MRTRNKAEPTKTGTITLKRNGTTVATGSHVTSSHSETAVDVATPNFRSRMSKGEILNNPCTISKTTLRSGGGSLYMSNGTNTYTTSGDGSLTRFYLNRSGNPSGIVHPATKISSGVLANLKAEALGAVDRAPKPLVEDILEFRETLRLLRDPLSSLRHLSDVFSRKTQDLITGRRYSRARAMAESWASLRWGFYPIINSIDTVIGGLTGPQYYRKSGQLRVAEASVSYKDSAVQPSLKQNFGTVSYNEYEHYETLDERARAYVLYRITDPLNGWRQTFGLRAKDIPEGLWAVVPWSFLVDRVVDVSARIRGVTALSDPSIEILGGGVVHKSERIESWRFKRQYDPPYSFLGGGDVELKTISSYSRTIWNPTVADLLNVDLDWKGLVGDSTSIADSMSAAMLIFTRGLNRKYQYGY